MRTLLKSEFYSGNDSLKGLKAFISGSNFSSVIVLADENTQKHCLPLINNALKNHEIIVIKSGEENKTIATCMEVWKKLSNANTDRKALLINLGGGVLCDTGGFIASAYMRGIDFVHIPTTLLSMCDSCIGGKLGVNIDGLKNHIGTFKNPIAIFIYPEFLKTLSGKNILSGFAEIIKHSLIGDKRFFKELCDCADYKKELEKFITHSIKIKTRIVNLDTYEKGIRKSLNFGHSIGHALESYFLLNHPENPIYHGEAVAMGMICESWLSYKRNFISNDELDQITTLILRYFPKIIFDKKDFEEIIGFIKKDKKNEFDKKLFTLLDGIGQFRVNENISNDEILQALDFYADL